jgi:hypothetical protein
MMPIPVYLLAASVAINAALGVAWQRAGNHARELQAQIAAVTGERDHALQTARACSDGVARLQALAESRAREAAAARKLAAQAAADHARRADAVLSAPPAVPGDDCASAKARVAAWLQRRRPWDQ